MCLDHSQHADLGTAAYVTSIRSTLIADAGAATLTLKGAEARALHREVEELHHWDTRSVTLMNRQFVADSIKCRSAGRASAAVQDAQGKTLGSNTHLAAVSELFSEEAAEVDAPASRPAQWQRGCALDVISDKLQVPDQVFRLAAVKRAQLESKAALLLPPMDCMRVTSKS
jgi:hypothetical protein